MAIIKAADQITIVDVTDGYSVDLSSNSYVFGGTADGQVTSTQTIETIIQATRGADVPSIDVDQNAIDIRPINNGVTATYSVETVGGKNIHKVTIQATVATREAGTVTIPVKLDGGEGNGGVTINKVFSFNIAKAGSSIVDVQNWYLATSASSGVTKDTAGWTTTIQQMTAVNQYLWNYEVTYGTGQIELDSTAPVIIGRYGQDGSAGKSIDSIVEWYQVSAISATPPATPSEAGTGYERNPQVTSVNTPYLWNYEVIYYTDNTYTVTNARIIGVHGLTGPAGTGISSTLIKYAVNTSSTTPPVSFPTGSDWHDDVQPTAAGQYLWTGMKFIYDDGTESLPVYTVAAHGTPATTYHLQSSTDAIIKPQTGSLIPSSITFSSYQQTGNDNPLTYTGDFGIAVSTNGSTFGTETITTNVDHVDYSPASSVKLIKCTLYKLGTGSGSSKVVYDTQTVPVLSDGKSATQYYTYIRYSENPNGQGYVPTPTATTKYIGVCVTTSSTVPAYNSTDWKWSLYVGANGYNTATKYIYKRLGTAPSTAPADSTYTFSSGTISNIPTGWTENIPEQNQNGDPCYVTSATAISQEDTGTLDWAVPTLFIENAYNSATIYLYKRGETSPAGPTADLTYDFTTGQLIPSTALNGWSLTVPVDSTAPCWVIMATVLTNVDTDTIADTEWSTPIRIDGKDGAKGLNQATVFYYKRSASAPNISSDNPGNVTYTFETGASASPSNTWYRAIPTSDGTPCWVTSASAIGRENTANITSDKWSAATKLVEDGADAYTIILTNENHTFAGDTISALEDSTTCGIIAYKGEDTINTRVRVANITGIPTGMTVTASGGNNYVANNVLTIAVTSAMNTRNGILTIPVEVPGNKTFNMNFTYSLSLIGEPATAYKLIVSNAAVVKTASGYTPSSITLSSKKQTGSASMENYSGKFKIEKTTDGSTWTKVYVSDSPESSYSCSIPANIKSLRCLLYTEDSTFNSEGALTGGVLLDQQVVPIVTDGINGEPAYTVILSNENHTFQGNNTAALNSSTECEIIAYKGASKIVSTIGTITGVPDGMSINISNSSTTSTLSKFTITVSPDAEHLLTSGGGVLTVPVTVDGKVFNMNFTYSVAFKGDTGAAGRNGTDGYNTATVYLYRRSESQPTGTSAKPNNTLTYTFSSKALTPSTALNGWSAEVPTTGTAPCWLISATANANTAQDTIPTTEWSVPIRIDGIDGIDGLNQATLFYYKRSANSPNTNPGSITYTFADGSTTTISDNWTKTIPASDGNPCWVVSAVAISREGTVNIPSTAWSTPSKIVEDGKDGDPATAYSLIISAAAITKAINGAYTPSTITLNSKKQTGNEQIADYPARFKIETTSNGVDWSTSSGTADGLYYQSSTDESSKTFRIPDDIIALRCSLYADGGFTTLLDQQIVPIVEDGSDSYTVILSDENHTFAGTDTAAIASTASCDVMVYKGSTEVIATIGTIQYPSNMSVDIYTGSTDPFVWPRFTVSVNNSFNTRNGTLNIPITVVDNGQRLSFTKVFTYSLALNGSSPVVRELEVSQAAIVRDEDGNYTPSTLVLRGKKQVGNLDPEAYSGRFLIEKTTDGSTWTEVDHSSVNESTYTLSTIPFGISALRCTLYASGGLTTQLDQQVVPIVEDGSDSYTVVLSNESHTYAGTDSAPVPAIVVSQVIAYRGSEPVYVKIGDTTRPRGMTITPNYPNPYTKGNIDLTITTDETFNTVSGTVNIPVRVNPFGDPDSSEYEDYTQEFTKVFTFTTALKGQAAEIYMLDVDNATVTKRGGEYTPGSIVVTSKRKIGNDTPTTYNKWFRIETSAKGDGTDWSTSQSGSALYYQSTNAEATHTFNLNNSYSIKAIRCTLYDSSSFNVILDQQIVPVISDGYNSATVYLYKLSASQPSSTAAKPSGTLTYDFSNGTLTPSTSLNGWSQTVQTGSNPCWMIVATTISSELTDTIATSEWSTPIRIDGLDGEPGAPGTPGQPGAHGYNTATVYFYKRTNTAPASTDRPGTSQYPVTYNFTTGATSSSASTPYFGWSRDISTSNGSTCWVTSGIALSQENTVTISTWADPTKLVEDGYSVVLTNESHSFPGKANASSAAVTGSTAEGHVNVYKGTSQLICYLGASSSATSINTGITGLTCTITNNNSINPKLTFTASPSGGSTLTTNGYVDIPIVADGQSFTKRFSFTISKTGSNGTSPTIQDLVIDQAAVIRTKEGIYSPETLNFSATQRIGNGTPTAYSGLFKVEYFPYGNNEWGNVYESSSASSSISVKIKTSSASGYYEVPSTATLIRCSLYKTSIADANLIDRQTIPIVVDGTDGADAYNSATIYLYKRNSTQPAAPSQSLTYTFSTGTITGTTDGWQQSVPTGSTATCWMIAATATSNQSTDTIASSDWSTPIIIEGKNGDPGYSQATVYIYKRASTATKPTGTTTYTFSGTEHFTVPSGWNKNIPSSNGYPCWVVTGVAVSNTDSAAITWSDPTKLVEDGYTISLTNENDNFPGQANGVQYAEANQTAKCGVKVYKGITDITSTISSLTVSSITNTVGSTTTDIKNKQLRASVNSTTKEITFTTGDGSTSYPYLQKGSGVATISITVDGQTFTKQFTFSVTVTGPAGKGITNVTEYYAISNSTTAPGDSSFSEGVKTPTAANPYLWNYEKITYTDNSSVNLDKHIVLIYTQNGSPGRGISSIAEYYAVNNSTTAPADNAFSTTVVNPTEANPYLWNYELITYVNGTPATERTDKRIIGTFGERGPAGPTGPTGPEGAGISDTEIKYAKSTNGTTPPQSESDWKNSVELVGTINPGEYLWTRTRIYYSDNRTPVTSYSVAAYGTNGDSSVTLSISSSNGWQIQDGNIVTTLTAKVFVGLEEKTVSSNGTITDLGIVKWYKNGSSSGTSSKTVSVNESSSVNKVSYAVQVESGSNTLARTEVTVTKLKSILATYVFYYSQSSAISNPPTAPTDSQVNTYISTGQFPSGCNWSDAEPVTVDTSTNLFRVEVTRYSDLTYDYSVVTKDSSYEAAKQAKTIADQANTTAGNANTTANTALTNSTNAVNKVNQESEIITGTQTAATASWTGTSQYITSLTDGLSINYWLPYNSASNATLNLTLANNTTTGAKDLYYSGTTRLGTQYTAGNLIRLVYRVNIPVAGSGSYTGWWADANYNSDTNYYDRLQYNSAIKAATAITAGHLICGTAAGYLHVAANATFDLSYPLLYAGSAIAVNATGTNNYLNYAVTFSTSGTITSGAANKILYLKGTVDGNTFTVASSGYLTTVTPTSEDEFYYIPLGTMTSATAGRFVSSNRLFAYIFDAFQAVDIAVYKTGSKIQKVAASTNVGIMSKSLIMRDSTGAWASLTTTSGIGEDKVNNPNGLFIDKIYYSTGYSSGTSPTYISTSGNTVYTKIVYTACSGVDLRYSTNCGSNLITGKPVYLVGTTQEDNLFKVIDKDIDSSWTQTIPEKDILLYDSSSTYAVGDYVTYKEVANFSTTESYDVGDYVKYSNKYWCCTSPVNPGEWDSSQWTDLGDDISTIPDLDLYRCKTAISTAEAFNATKWILVTDYIYLYLGVANSSTTITLEEDNTILRWVRDSGLTEYSLYLKSTYNSEFKRYDDRIESKVSQSTYSTFKDDLNGTITGIKDNFDPTKTGSYAALVSSQFTTLKQTSNKLSFSLYGANIYDGEEQSSTDPSINPSDTSISGKLKTQGQNLTALQNNIAALATYSGADAQEDGTYKGPVDYFSLEGQGLIIGSSGSAVILRAQNASIEFIDTNTKTPLVTISTSGMSSQENVLSEQINMFNNWAFRKGASDTIGVDKIIYNLNDVWTGG